MSSDVDHLIVNDFSEDSLNTIRIFISSGGKFIKLAPSCPQGVPPFDLPEDLTICDLRYGGSTFVRGKHPRLEGIWTQYSHLDTGLSRHLTLSHTITDQTPIENWRSQPHSMQIAPVGALDSEAYRHAHNHYQLLHSEVYNFSRDLNGVAIWGDSAALAPNAKSWGAFFSARSWPLKWGGYTPPELFDYREEDFDAALVGVEIDVLNAGKDWFGPKGIDPDAMAKVGLQLVGFGNKNTAAIEIRTEDTDDPNKTSSERRGAWHWGIIMRNALDRQSTVLMSENGHIAKGIDFDKTTFSDGAFRIAGAGSKSGIIFDNSASGEIYSNVEDTSINIRVGQGGLKILSSDGSRVILEITDDSIKIHQNDRESFFKRIIKKLLTFI